MQQVTFCFLTSAQILHIYVCMHAWVNTHPHIMLSISLPMCLCWKHFKRGWNYSHLHLWHHFSVFTLFHIIYLLYLALCSGSPFLTLRHTYFIVCLLNLKGVSLWEIWAAPIMLPTPCLREPVCACACERERARGCFETLLLIIQ